MKTLLALSFFCGLSVIIAQETTTPEKVRGMISGDIKALNIAPETIFKVENRTIEGIPI